MSGIIKSHDFMKEAILESIYAYVYGKHTNKRIFNYEALEDFILLLELRQSKVLEKYRNKFQNKINEFDEEHKLEINKVLELMVSTGGNIKEIAEKLYIHETTARYRINKFKEHLKYKNFNDFYVDVKLAIYAQWILDDEILCKIR